MKKPTILRILIVVLAMLCNFASYSQNSIAFNSKFTKNLNENIFFKVSNELDNTISSVASDNMIVPIIPNPIIKYAQGSYAGVVSKCPNDGSELPKLFLCGVNDSRLIQTGITDASEIVWQRRTGGCTTNLNANCANTANNCTWADVGTGPNYNANSAGEFKVVITNPEKNVVTFYFNVYKTEVDPSGITKIDVVKDGAGCTIPGSILVKDFGVGYEYSFTTNPSANTWQDSNKFVTSVADTYNVFIRMKDVAESCIYSVKNVVISTINFSSALTAVQPACFGQKGSIKVNANAINNDYVYAITKSPNNKPFLTTTPSAISEHEFTGLDAGTYTVLTTIDGTCATDLQTIEIKAANVLNNTSYIDTNLSVCTPGIIMGRANGGEGTTYRYFINYNSTGFVPVSNAKVIVDKGGTYQIRVEDLNGCTADQTFTIAGVNKPVYTINTTSSGTCNPTGTITVNVTNQNGYNTIQYSKDNGTNWQDGNSFSDLQSGDYNITIRYRTGSSGNYCTDAFTTITIGTTVGLTASAGVAAFQGCRTEDDRGIVRITNPQGGLPPYEYFFSNEPVNHNGWSTNNVGYLPAGGPYTVSIRDKNACTFDMTGIVIDGKPSAPKIDYGPTVYNCDGTATQTVNINNGAGDPRYNFQYYLDGNPNPNTAESNVFLNVPAGFHIISVDYKIKSATTYSNLLEESFGSGENTFSPGINTFYYCFERQLANQPATWCNGSYAINDGDYSVTSSINQTATSSFGWIYPEDHTGLAKGVKDPRGRFLAVNIGDKIPVTTILYEKQINDLIPNQPINFEFYVMNLMMPGKGRADPDLRIALVDDTGKEISWFTTGSIVRSSSSTDWKKFPQTPITLNPGNYTSLRFIVRSNVKYVDGNDVAIDDIKVFQVPKVCGAQFKWEFTITPPPPFTSHIENLKAETCFGTKDGSFDIYAENFTGEFYYSINNQEPWIKSTKDRVTIGPLTAASYSVRVRRDPTSQGCDFDIPTTVKSPGEFKYTIGATTGTCSEDAVVTATSITGGTFPYNLLLTANGVSRPFILDPDGLYRVRDVKPGTYAVTGTDSNSCQQSVTTNITVSGSVSPTAKIESNSNLCFSEGTGASIVIRINGGKGKYSYRVKRDGGLYSDYSLPFDGPTFTHDVTASGNYEFEIIDTNGCYAQVSQHIDPKLTAKSAVTSTITCKAGGSDATIQVTISGGTAPYTYTIKNSSGTNLPSGGTTTNPVFQYSTGIADTYTFDIKDANGCPISISQKVNTLTQVTAKSTPHDPKCNGGTGSVDLEALTGVAPFTFEFNGTGGFTNQTHYENLPGSASGITYSYRVQDANECIRAYTFKILEPAVINGTATLSPVYNCDHPATITVSGVSGGTGPYKYTLLKDADIAAGPQEELVFANLSVAGVYTVTITDANSCTKTINAGTITALNPPAGMTITTTTAATCPINKGSVTISNVVNAANAAVPTAGLEYRIVLPAATAFQPGNVFNNLDVNVSYTFEVRDANKCIYQKSYTIALPTAFAVGGVPTNVKCFGDSNGSASFTVTGLGNNVSYTYSVTSGASGSGASPVTGSSTVTISITGLSAGNHTITVTSGLTKCSVSEMVTVGGPTAALKLNAPDLTHVTCKDLGTAKINAVDGWGTYTYTVTPIAPAGAAKVQVNNNLFQNLTAGIYNVSVTDLGDCTVATQNFTINGSVDPIASIDATSDFCASGAGATIKVSPNTAANFTYSIDGGTAQNNGTFTGVAPGNHTITVTDTSTGCHIDLTVPTIAQPLSATPSTQKDLDCSTTTPASSYAIIKVDISNGYPDFKYKVNTTGAPFTGGYTNVGAGLTSFTYPAPTAATYYFEITDSKDCTVVVSRTINSTVKHDFDTDLVHVKCNGGNTGSITVNTVPAVGTYQYVLTPTAPAGSAVTQSTNVFNGLGAGDYSIVVINDITKCKSNAKLVTITQPNALTGSASVTTLLSCGTGNVAQNAIITVTATDGTPFSGVNKYRYDYGDGNGFVNSNTFTATAPGLVTVIIKDANDCTITRTTTVIGLNPPTALTITPSNAITCNLSTANLKLDVTNGVGPFKYEITSPTATAVTNNNSNTYTFNNLAVGHYYLKVTDANNCTITNDFEIKTFTPITVSGSMVTPLTCHNSSTGAIRFNVGGDTGTYSFVIKNSANTVITTGVQTGNIVNVTNLPSEAYTIVVTNPSTGCTATDKVVLANPTAVTITSATGTKVFCAPNVNTTITVKATGGSTPLKYAVVKTGVSPVSTDYNTTGVFTKDTSVDGLTYDVYVEDNNGCPATSTVSITKDTPPVVNTPAVSCYTGSSFNITITGTVDPNAGAPSTVMYGLDGSFKNTPTFAINGPGIYSLSIKDANGCVTSINYVVNSILTLKHVLDKDLTCSVPVAAQVTLTAEGGNNAYIYEYKLETTGTYAVIGSNIYNPTVKGNYYFKVTSAGCSTEIGPIVITDPEIPTAAGVETNPKCNNVSEGTITITPSGGVPGYQYRINGGAWQDSPVFTDLAAAVAPGTVYTYQVIDAKKCISVSKNITLTQPAPIAVNRTIVGITCNVSNGVSLGSITINSVTGGTGPYNYYVSGTNAYYREFKNVPGTSQVFEIVDFGFYEIKITDANGCIFTEEVTITSPPEDLDITVNAPPPADCSALGSAVVAVGSSTSIPIGNGPFFFSYYTGVKPVYPTGVWYPESPAKQATISGLIPGVKYTFIVYDSKSGCYYYETATMPIPSNTTLTVGAPTAQNVTCKGSGDGKVSFVVTSIYSTPTPITYQVYDALSLAPLPITGSGTIPANGSLTISGFGAMAHGDYFVLVKEDIGATNAGCSLSTAKFSIRQSAELLSLDYVIVQNDNCKPAAGIIRVSGKDGTGPYKYMITTTPGTPLAADPAWATSPIFNKDTGNYYAWVKDDFGCIQGTPVFLLPEDPSPVIAISVPNLCAAEGAFSISVDLTNSPTAIPPFYISVNNNTSYTSVTGFPYLISNLAPGHYDIYVKDKNGCEVQEQIDIKATPKLAVTSKQLDCSVLPNANIGITITDGTAPFRYEVKKGTAVFSAPVALGASDRNFDYPIVAADADTYIIKVIDKNNCEIQTSSVIIAPLVPIVPDYTPTEPLCNGGTGTILLSATGGKGNYTYTLIRTAPTAGTLVTQNVPFFEGLIAGNYTYTIKDELGCEVTDTAELKQPTEVFADAPIITPFGCGTGNAAQDAIVVLGATGGSGDYEFSFNNSGFSDKTTYNVIDNEADQLNIPYTVRDKNGCSKSGTIDIFKLDRPVSFDIAHLPVITCQTPTTTVTISNPVNTAGPITVTKYEILSPASAVKDNGNNPVFAGLLPGDYVFQITDGAGCTKQLPYTIKDVVKIDITGQSTTDITCLNEIDGKASFLVTGFGTGVGTYNYVVDGVLPAITGPADGKINLSGLAAGLNHTIKVEDDETKCDKTITFDILAPGAALTIGKTVTPLGCLTKGAVTVTAQDGWGDYVFRVKEPDGNVLPSNTTGIFGGLTKVGVYDISVKDAKGCVKSDTFELFTPINPNAAIDASTVYCYTYPAGAKIVVTASSTSPFITPTDVYDYSIDNGQTWQSSNTFDNLNPGDYTITVRDKFGCIDTTAETIKINTQFFASAKKDKDIYCAPAGSVNGLIKVQAAGGYPPYSYTVTKDGILDPTLIAFPTAAATEADYVVSGTAAGKYVFTITDSRSCSLPTNEIIMLDPTPVVFTATPISPSCANSQGDMGDGQISVALDPSNNNGGYTYTILRTVPAGGILVTQTTGLFSGLIAGTYTVNVTSTRGCDAPVTIEIFAPTPVVANALKTEFECTSANVIKETVVTVTGTGGKGTNALSDYRYSNNGTDWYTTNQFRVFDNGTTQNLTYFVKDLNNCIDATDPVIVTPFPQLISASTRLVTAADCPNLGQQTVGVDIVGGATPYDFKYQVYKDGVAFGTEVTVTPGQNTFDYVAPDAGHSYYFLITDNNTKCTIISDSHEVNLYNTMKVIANASSMVTCNGLADGKITINIENYTGIYNYRVLIAGATVVTGTGINALTDNPYIITGLAANADYEVEVSQQDYPRCIVLSDKVNITQPEPLNIDNMILTVVNQNCRNLAATITIDPSGIVGGTKGYKFAILPQGTPVTTYTTDLSKTFTTTATTALPDTWIVYVQDDKGCSLSKTVNVWLDPMPVIDDVKVISQCASTAGYRIEVTATGPAPLKYSIDGFQFQDDNFFTVFAAGDYTVHVMDKNQCKVTAPAPVTVLEGLTLRAEVELPTCKSANGTITLFAAGGTVTPANSYVYTMNNWATSQLNSDFTALAPGTYSFIVRDTGTNCTKDLQVIIPEPTLILDLVATPRAVTCNGGDNGGILVKISDANNNPEYKYSLTGIGVSIVDQISPEFNNLKAGLYTVTVKSGRGCEDQKTVQVSEPAIIEVNATYTEFGCTTGNTTNNAVITVNSVIGGAGPGKYVLYEFRKGADLLYSGPLSTYRVLDYSGGTYTVTAYDSNNCSGTNTTPIQIRSFATLLGINFNVTPITCTTGETIETIVDVRGTLTTPLQYTLTGTDVNGTAITPIINNDGKFSGLAIGNYLVTVLNTATNCTIAQNHQVLDPNTFTFKVDATRADICFGDADGNVELTLVDNRPFPTDRAGAFTYTVSGPVPSNGTTTGVTLPLTGLTAGRYVVDARLVGSPECDIHTTFDIAQPSTELKMTVTPKRITCANGNSDGAIDVVAEGGWAGTYQYELVGAVSYIYSAVGYFENLTPGHYVINVKDSKDCIISSFVDLVIPDEITFDAAATSTLLTCYGDNSGVITVTNTKGGEGSNYVYSLTYTTPEGDVSVLGPQNSNIFTGLKAGSYVVNAADGFSCEKISPTTITLTNPAKVQAELSQETGITCKTDATLTLTVTGGTGPYTYSEDELSAGISFNGPSTTFPVSVGLHHYFVKDKFGCISAVSNDIGVDPVTPLAIKLDLKNAIVNCTGQNTALIYAVATGGLGNYQYTLFDSNKNVIRIAQPDGIFADLYAGTYYVHVKSVDCETDEQVLVSESPTPLISDYKMVPVKCNNDNTGQIIVTASGGTGAIKFAIEPYLDQFVNSGTFVGLKAGFYTVVVQDVLGCFNKYRIEVTEPPLLIAYEVPNSMIPEVCKGEKNGAFAIEIQGGIPPYFESLGRDNGPWNPVIGTTKEYTDLSGGRYSVFIKDSNGCIYPVEVNMPESVILDPTYTISYDCVNNTQSNMVVVTVDERNNTVDIDYSLDGGTIQPDNIFTNIPTGDHTIRIRHTNGCTADVDFNIIGYAKLELTVTEEKGVWNVITASAVGGGGKYEYSIDGVNFSEENKFKIYKTGIYTIIVRDKNGCTDTKDYNINYIDVCLDNYFTPNGDGVYDTWGPGCTNIYNNLEFSIFDRYGRVIAKYHYGQKWDGRYNGEELPSGDYWYVLKLNDKKDDREFVGHFTLYR